MKKILLVLGLVLGVLLSFNPASRAQTVLPDANVDTILEENALREALTRYTSMLVFFQPEEASRLGLSAGNNRLNDRSATTETQMLQALESVFSTLKGINDKHLSPAKRIEYHLLKDSVERNIWSLQQNRLTQDPLYYAQALDALYDLLLQTDNSRKQRTDMLGRLEALPQVYQQAQQNLTSVSPRLAQLAMEKAYYASLSFDAIRNCITNGGELTNDTRDSVTIENALLKGKTSIDNLFELFKNLSKQPIELMTPLGAKSYTQKLNAYYQLNKKPAQLEAALNARWDEAQHQLFAALRPFELSADEEEVTIVDDLNLRPQEKLPTPKNNTNTLEYTPPTANQFYAVAGQLVSPYSADQLFTQFTQLVNTQNAMLLGQKALAQAVALKIQELIPYFAYQQAFLTYPAFSTFWVRMPQGNEFTKMQTLNRDFNEPAVKLFISEEIVPGNYYQTQVQKNAMRRLFGSPLLSNGWTLYALRLAQQTNIFVTDEELLFAAWQRFVRTLSAVVDYRLHTQQYTYTEALAFLTEQNGFTQEQALQLVDGILRAPGEAVSFIAGESIWQENADKYLKKMKDNDAVTALLLEIGNVSPSDLAPELKRLYRK